LRNEGGNQLLRELKEIKVTKEQKEAILERFNIKNAVLNPDLEPKGKAFVIWKPCILCEQYSCFECPVTEAVSPMAYISKETFASGCIRWLERAWYESPRRQEVDDISAWYNAAFTKSAVVFWESGKIVIEALYEQLKRYLRVPHFHVIISWPGCYPEGNAVFETKAEAQEEWCLLINEYIEETASQCPEADDEDIIKKTFDELNREDCFAVLKNNLRIYITECDQLACEPFLDETFLEW